MTELIFKWLKSENASSKETKRLAKLTKEAFQLTSRQYRKLLSWGREQEKVLESQMSQNRWEEIQFDKLPSKAGMKYRAAFGRNPITSEKYRNFMNSKETKSKRRNTLSL